MNENSVPKNSQKLNISLDYRWIAVALLVVIVAMLALWRPWQGAKTTDRTVEVSGQATLSAKPDEFVFYPSYQFTGEKEAALEQLSKKNNEALAKLKELGVADKDIKTNAGSWSYPIFKDSSDAAPVYSLQITIAVASDELAQKVQDYLVASGAEGSISPQASFSDKKRKELEDKARDEASKDARSKAEKSALNLGFRIAAVKKVTDGSGFDSMYPLYDRATTTMDAASASSASLPVQPGENDLTYNVTVTYFIK